MMDVNDHELEVLEFWEKNKTFEKSLEKTKNSKPYIFYDGPPFATGLPHHGHLMCSMIKDLFGRFWTMNDRYVRRVWGWDCHGLPIENIAEQGLGINSKDEIEKMGVEKFNSYCRSKVLSYTDEWKKIIKRIGRWVDMDNAYKTMDNSYIESVWWAFKQLYDKGYIYEGEKVLMYCPRCSTPLSKSEITMDNSYKTVKDSTMVVKFKLVDEDAYAIAWTTTPWTLPSNLALAVNPKMEYVYVKDKDGTTYVLAKDLIGEFWKSEDEYEIVKTVKGKDLEGKKYEPLFDYFKDTENAFQFILGDFVTAEDGTGIVHTAPNFGEDDYAVCRKYNIPTINSVDAKGLFTAEVRDFAGEFVHDVDVEVIKKLKEEGKVVLVKKMEHEYPFCYRCDTKLIYKALPAWFVDIQKIKPRLLELNKKLNWLPENLKEGRVKHNLENAPDWNISRNRYWATAIPIWKAEDGELLVIGSVDELKKYAKKLPKKELDLHKDYLDQVVLVKDGKEFKRILEVMDCWFESGAMTFAQFHYPFENKEFFEKNFPAQFVSEYIAQVRTWFYYMNVLAAILFDEIPFENIVTSGTILAEDGQKMSKSKNNFTDPMVLVKKYGVDAIRFYLMSTPVMNAQDMNFLDSQVEEIYKKVLLLLYNVNNFYSEFKDGKEVSVPKSKDVSDKWIISRLNECGLSITESLKSYNTIKASAEIRSFVEDLSTWYVRLNRDRFNSGDEIAVSVLKYVLDRFSKLIAPIMPFIAEKIYWNIKDGESVHLQNWPEFDKKLVDNKLLEEMARTREIVSQGLKFRDQNQTGLKWPLAKAIITGDLEVSKEMQEIILSELNVKSIEFSKGEELSVELDLKMTPELEAEGFARELSRKVQAGRKKAGLVKEDNIKLTISENFKDVLGTFVELVKERVGADEILFSKKIEKDDFTEDGKIKNKEYSFSFSKA